MNQSENTAEKPQLIIPNIDADGIATLHNTKDFAQYCKKVETLLAKKCEFCQLDTELNKILYGDGVDGREYNESWVLWKSAFPQSNQDLHLVIALRRHLKDLKDLTKKEQDDSWLAIQWAMENFPFPGGALSMRSGDSDRHAGSVPGHLHWNIQVPNKTGRVQVTLCKDPKEIQEKTKMLLVFEKLRLGASVEALFPEELELVKGRI